MVNPNMPKDGEELQALLDEFGSDRAVARHVGCSHPYIRKLRMKWNLESPYTKISEGAYRWREVCNDPICLLELQEEYGSSGNIANVYGVNASTVQRAFNKHGIELTAKNQHTFIPKKFKALLIDIETSPNVGDIWSLWNQNVSLNQLRESSRMICFAAKWKGEKKVHFYSEFHNDREEMLSRAWELMSEADALIHYHGNGFDVPSLNKEFLFQGWSPPKSSKQIDLYRVVKKHFKLPSYKFDYVAQKLGCGGKIHHEGHTLWVKCMAGDPKAWATMKKYNIQDTVLLEDVYKQLLPWITNHPNQNLYNDKLVCTNCGATEMTDGGFTFTNTGVYKQYQCDHCGTWVRENKRVAGVTTQQTKF